MFLYSNYIELYLKYKKCICIRNQHNKKRCQRNDSCLQDKLHWGLQDNNKILYGVNMSEPDFSRLNWMCQSNEWFKHVRTCLYPTNKYSETPRYDCPTIRFSYNAIWKTMFFRPLDTVFSSPYNATQKYWCQTWWLTQLPHKNYKNNKNKHFEFEVFNKCKLNLLNEHWLMTYGDKVFFFNFIHKI